MLHSMWKRCIVLYCTYCHCPPPCETKVPATLLVRTGCLQTRLGLCSFVGNLSFLSFLSSFSFSFMLLVRHPNVVRFRRFPEQHQKIEDKNLENLYMFKNTSCMKLQAECFLKQNNLRSHELVLSYFSVNLKTAE